MTDAVAVDTTTVDEQVSATVTQASPLRVLVDGATVDSSANSLDGTTYTVGSRATVSVRNPVPPLIQGTESPDPATTGGGGSGGGAATTVTVAAGTTTTGAPGTNAAVSNSGSDTAAVFDFTIPRGDVGATGDAGPANTLAIGTVASGTPAAANITGASPNQTLNLTLPKGDAGPKGDPGTPGSAATVAVGSTSTLAAGSAATVTNTGTSSAAVFSFGIPQGAQGPKGDPGTPGTGTVNSVNSVSPDGAGNVTLTAANVSAVPTSSLGAANGVATLAADGTLTTSQLPALALVNVTPVASQAAMLALTNVQPGDLATRTDGAGTFMLTATPPSTLANWTLLNAPTDKVVSVNGQTGTVNLSAANVGAAATASNLSDLASATSARSNLGLGGAATLSVGTTTGTVAAGDDSRITSAVPNTRTVNGKALSGNITLAASDVGGVPTSTTVNGHPLSGNVSVTAADVGAATASQGVPPGGSAGQVLTKNSGTNYDTAWVTSARVLTVASGTAVPGGTPDGTLFVEYTP